MTKWTEWDNNPFAAALNLCTNTGDSRLEDKLKSWLLEQLLSYDLSETEYMIDDILWCMAGEVSIIVQSDIVDTRTGCLRWRAAFGTRGT